MTERRRGAEGAERRNAGGNKPAAPDAITTIRTARKPPGGSGKQRKEKDGGAVAWLSFIMFALLRCQNAGKFARYALA